MILNSIYSWVWLFIKGKVIKIRRNNINTMKEIYCIIIKRCQFLAKFIIVTIQVIVIEFITNFFTPTDI